MQDRPVPWQQLAAKLLPCWRLLAPCPCWLLPPRQNLAQYITKLLRERWRLDCHRARAGRVCYRVLRWQPCSHSTAVHQGPVRPPSAATLIELVLHSNQIATGATWSRSIQVRVVLQKQLSPACTTPCTLLGEPHSQHTLGPLPHAAGRRPGWRYCAHMRCRTAAACHAAGAAGQSMT